MGVRESCQEGGELNIHDLAIESETKRESSFDANVDVLPEEWEKLREWFEAASGGTSDPITDMGAPSKFIFPDKNLIPDLKNSKDMFGSRRRPIVTSATISSGGFDVLALEHDFALKAIIPDCKYCFDDPENWEKFLGLLDQEVDMANKRDVIIDHSLLNILRDAKISYPERINNLRLEKFRERVVSENFEQAEEAYQGGVWQRYAYCLAITRLLYPEQMQDYKIDKTAWQGMRESLERELHDKPNPDWRTVLDLALDMQILAAEDVVFDKNSLHLVMPSRQEKFQESTPELPVRKQF